MSTSYEILLFGATGDLAHRKLLPALYRAYQEKSLPEYLKIFLTCRSQKQSDALIDSVRDSLSSHLHKKEFSESQWQKFKTLLFPIVIDISESKRGWSELIRQVDNDAERVFYFSIAPSLYAVCCENLANHQLISKQSRVVLEKPIGYDQETAENINQQVGKFFSESQIFRIDHYLGKEAVQNLMALRFDNLLFEKLWDRDSIDHVQISICETVGLEGRAGFYDDAGAMRDMVQNHLLQLLCLIAMEAPNNLDSDSIRTEKIKVLKSLRPIVDEQVKTETVRGQYVTGESNGKQVSGYLEELQKPSSNCETFVAIRTYLDNWRWSGVPFYLRTGKRLKKRCAEIIVQFKEVSHSIYSKDKDRRHANRLTIQLQPNEKIELALTSKNLGAVEMQLKNILLDLNLNQQAIPIQSDAYKRLLLDVIGNDPSLFIHREEINQAWQWVDPIISGWKSNDSTPSLYRAGTWGPEAAERLIKNDGKQWINEED